MNQRHPVKRVIGRILRVLTCGFSGQNFLGQPWIPYLFKVVPKKYRRGLALRLIGISPHYFIYQWSDKYPSTMSHMEILKAESQRNLFSRKKICTEILCPYLSPGMTVLDFGCGPGYLAHEVAKYSKEVFAVDISCGAIACARELNNSVNLSYHINNGENLSFVHASSVDLIYSFAVVQHLYDELFERILEDFFRLLKPQGKVVCHVALKDEYSGETESREKLLTVFLRKKFAEHYVCRSAEDVNRIVTTKGFTPPLISQIKEISSLKDAMAEQHLFVFSKP